MWDGDDEVDGSDQSGDVTHRGSNRCVRGYLDLVSRRQGSTRTRSILTTTAKGEKAATGGVEPILVRSQVLAGSWPILVPNDQVY